MASIRTGRLVSDLYTKPTERHLYLHKDSSYRVYEESHSIRPRCEAETNMFGRDGLQKKTQR
ncbi:hypothetical protein DPMN_086801 [Dreissena polymorpha]|uniref:Uncharacterized protein n=1 Tax=Dreissena polymorpha TaxID=45954 RepID=A0A9D4KSJ0_DREPO|nr:hypothetical protein DPMN_086801 [Dreissena polymorpha]